MQRYKITIAYRGTKYHGWQKQLPVDTYKGPPPGEGEGIPTIEETLSRALVSVVKHPVVLSGSSRTDSGVHAKGQVAHFDTDQVQIPVTGLLSAANHALPEDIVFRTNLLLTGMSRPFDSKCSELLHSDFDRAIGAVRGV